MALGDLVQLCQMVPAGGCPFFGQTLAVEFAFPNPAGVLGLWDHARWDATQYRWSGFGQWQDLSDRLRGLTITRGRTDPSYLTIPAGTMTVDLANDDGALSPWATSGPYIQDGVNLIRPGLVVRASIIEANGTWRPLFTGKAEGWPEDVAYDRHVTVSVVDTWSELAAWSAPMPAGNAGDTATARIGRLLDDGQWRFGRHLGASTVAVQAHNPDLDNNRAAEVLRVSSSDGGLAYTDGQGSLVFVARATLMAPPVPPGIILADCTDDLGGQARYPYATIVPASDDQRILNNAIGQAIGGVAQSTVDTGSMAIFGARSAGMGFPRDGLICDTDAQVKALCNDAIKLFAFDDLRVDAVVLNAAMDHRLPAVMARLDLFDGVRVMRELTGGGLDIALRVDGVRHDITPYEWSMTVATEGAVARTPTGWDRSVWGPSALATSGAWT